MCWISKNANKQIANKDIVVYKLLEKRIEKICFTKRVKYYAPIRDFEYEKNKKYCIDHLLYLKDPDTKIYYIHEGFHSFINISDIINRNSFFVKYSSFAIAKCVIPKGAEYYINESHEVVSNQIIFKKEIK